MCKVKRYSPGDFVDRLNYSFLKSGLTQVELAKRIGVERKTVINYLHGVSEPQVSILRKICKALHVSADYLLFGIKED